MDKLREALKKDFRKLYVKNYTTTWELERIKIDIEIDIMGLSNTLALIPEQAPEGLLESTIQMRCEEAKREERERIEAKLEPEHWYGGGYDGLIDKGITHYFISVEDWQALQEEK